MEKARQILLDAGVAENRIRVCVTQGSRSAAADILKMARDNHCGTIVVGRRGSSGNRRFRTGSVSYPAVSWKTASFWPFGLFSESMPKWRLGGSGIREQTGNRA